MRSTNPIKMHTNGLLINMYFNLQEQGPSTGEFYRHYRVLHQFIFRNRCLSMSEKAYTVIIDIL